MLFDIKNNGGSFTGTLTLNATVNGRSYRVYPYVGIPRDAAAPFVISDLRLSRGETKRFHLYRGGERDMLHAWFGDGETYPITIRLSTNVRSEITTNNEKSETLTLPR